MLLTRYSFQRTDKHLKFWRRLYVSPQTQHNTGCDRRRGQPANAYLSRMEVRPLSPASGATPLNCQSILPRASADTGGGVVDELATQTQ